MENNQRNSPELFSHKEQDKNKQKSLLKDFISKHKYIEIEEQPQICKAFGLPFQKDVFREVYRDRFYNFLLETVTTVATVERETGIPQKYLTVCKLRFEKLGQLKVVGLGICPTTKSRNVQFVTTNLNLTNPEIQIFTNQLSLFK